jgi:hypothetical protein
MTRWTLVGMLAVCSAVSLVLMFASSGCGLCSDGQWRGECSKPKSCDTKNPPAYISDKGEIERIADYLRPLAHDPDSISVTNCTTPLLTEVDCWVTTCDVRGRNPYGGLILKRETYSVSNEGIVGRGEPGPHVR